MQHKKSVTILAVLLLIFVALYSVFLLCIGSNLKLGSLCIIPKRIALEAPANSSNYTNTTTPCTTTIVQNDAAANATVNSTFTPNTTTLFLNQSNATTSSTTSTLNTTTLNTTTSTNSTTINQSEHTQFNATLKNFIFSQLSNYNSTFITNYTNQTQLNSTMAINSSNAAHLSGAITNETNLLNLSNYQIMEKTINVSYGYLKQNGRRARARNQLTYVSIINGTILNNVTVANPEIVFYNFKIQKRAPNLHIKLKINHKEYEFSNAGVNYIHINTFQIINGAVSYGNYTVNPSFSASNLNDLNYTYVIKQGQSILYNGTVTSNSYNGTFPNITTKSLQPINITFDTKGNSNYSALDPTTLILPTNVMNFIQITFANQQSTAIAANTPLPIGSYGYYGNIIGFNALKYSQYYTCNLNNAEFFFANGLVINSWLEGNMLNEMAANSACTSSASPNALVDSANILYWVNYPWPSSFLAANTGSAITNTIFLGWTGNVLSNANNLLNNFDNGEAPQLSCPNGGNTITCYYSEYDDGANVFNTLYQSFVGTTTPTGWLATSVTQDNGITTPTSGPANIVTTATYPLSDGANVVDVFANTIVPSGSDNYVYVGYTDGTGQTNVAAWIIDGSGSTIQSVVRSGGTTYNGNTFCSGGATPGICFPGVYSTLYSSSSLTTLPITYNNIDGITHVPAVALPIGYEGRSGTIHSAHIGWIRIRKKPPNLTYPNTTYGNIVPLNTILYYTTANTNCVALNGQVLSSNWVCGTLIVNTGNTLTTNGYSIFVNNSIINHGIITAGNPNNGGAGAVVDYQNGGTGGSFINSFAGSGGGGGGGCTYNGGRGGSTLVAGGAGGNSDIGNGAAGSAPGAPTITNTLILNWYENGMSGYLSAAGGGGGGADSGCYVSQSGDNGGSGSYGVYLQATNVMNYGSIIANGIAGGATAGGPGGGGGGGGVIVVSYQTTNTPTGNYLEAAGAGGSDEDLGGNGGSGQILYYQYTIPPILVCPSTGCTAASYTAPTTPTLILSNALIDQGQSILFTANTIAGQGTSPYTYAYNVYAYNTLNSANALIANMLFTGNTYASNSWFWTPNPNLYIGNTMFFANVMITDAHPTTVNSVANYFGYNALLIAAVPTESNTLIDLGQVSLLTAQPSGGTQSYSYKWYANYGSSVTCSGTGNQISGATASTYLASPTTTNSYAYLVTDSASTQVGTCSAGNTITVYPALGQPTISVSNTLLDQGQYTVIATYETGGTLPYTYNFLIFNSVSNTIVA
ncbi:MAG: hypothetical protein ABR981_03995, partial [Candidatus Micrarchaeaceae archaeon]